MSRSFGRRIPEAVTVILVILVSHAATADCVWKPVDGEGFGSRVLGWFRQVTSSAGDVRWSLSATDRTVSISLGDGSDSARIDVLLDDECRSAVSVSRQAGAKAWFSDADARILVDSLHLASMQVGGVQASGPRGPGDAGAFGIAGWLDVLFLAICLLMVAAAFAVPSENRRARALDAVLLIAAAFLAAWPLFDIPFTNDAPILRVAYAARDVFGDWNHPFLSYLLNRPAALLTTEPRFLRIVPFAFVVVEMSLFALAARKISGRRAAALVVVWMAVSVRRTAGMVDISDWNLAGIFLALTVLWLMDERPDGGRWKWVPVPALLILGGYSSSFLMVVPAGLLTVHVCAERIGGRTSWYQAATTMLAMAVVGTDATGVFVIGRNNAQPLMNGDLGRFVWSLFTKEPPLGMTLGMPLLIAAGFGVPAFRRFRSAWLFCIAALATAIVAIVMAFLQSNVNGAYYIGLFKGIAFVSAAVLLAAVPEIVTTLTRPVGRWLVVAERVVPAIAALGLVLLTFRADIPLAPDREYDQNVLGRFIERTGRGKVRVLTNFVDSDVLLEYRESVVGRMDIGVTIDPALKTWVRDTLLRLDEACCSALPDHFLVMWRNTDARPGFDMACDPRADSGCVELFVTPGEPPCGKSGRLFCYYECGRAQSP